MVAIINPTIGLLFVKMFSGNKGIARIWAIIVGYVICYGLIFIRIFIKGKKVVDLKQWKYALGLALPLLPHYLSQTMLNQADRIMISRMIGLSEAAMYGVAYSISIVLLFVNKAIHNSFTPWIYRKLKAKDYSDISSIINKLLVGVCLLNSFIILFGPELVHILAPTTYAEASRIIAPVTVSSFLIFIYGLFCNLEFYFEKKFHMMIISVCGAVLNILLNYKFIPNFGYVAAGYTTLISYLFFVIAHYCVVRYIEKKYLESTRIYDVKFVFFICSCMIAFAEVINLFLNMYVVRYSVAILAMLIVIVLLKRTMKNKD